MGKKEKEYILERIKEDSSGCWIWQNHIIWNGYGQISIREGDRVKKYRAHRYSYEIFKGEIPEGLDIDHLCRVRACANPDHLEAVTRKVNIQRGNTGKFPKPWLRVTECTNGHEYNNENTYIRPDTGTKMCKACRKQANINYRLKLQGI